MTADAARIQTTACPCRRAVPLDYSTMDAAQATKVLDLIAALGEWTTVTIGSRQWRVSRHCIALHGISGADMEDGGFERIRG